MEGDFVENGITRRVDSLGRVVVPKEYRKKIKINEGDLLELFLEDNGILIKKYELISSNDKFLKSYISLMSKQLECDVLICTKDDVVLSTNNKFISKQIIGIGNQNINLLKEILGITSDIKIINISPSGDLIGYVLFIGIKKDLPDLINFSSRLINTYFE